MTCARARLWLGITGVGSLVSLATIALIMGLPQNLLSSNSTLGVPEILQLSAVTGLFLMWLLPLDFVGGFLIPAKFERSNQSFGAWFRGYLVAALAQALLFILFGSMIMVLSQQYGMLGGVLAISLGIVGCFTVRNRMLLKRSSKSKATAEKLLDAIGLIQSWQIFVPRTVVVKHNDIGFTGGIVGIGRNAQIVIPEAWLAFTRQQLATAIARRSIAVYSGSYTRGLLLAFVWNVGGFAISSLLPGAGLTSVAGLATTVCGFTLWSFLGLLTLPTLSRNASLKIDQELRQQGISPELIRESALTMDQLQDDEPERPRLIETIFHPVPNVTSRNPSETIRGLAAWNVARTTLFFSWACLGFLSRSVHCNVGRPELWTMLPSD